MTLERTTMTMTDAVVQRPERKLTLIEKLEKELDDRELTCQDLFEDG